MSQESEKYRVSAHSLNIREAPNTASAILGRLVKSDVIEKLAESEDGQWIRINVNGVDGWSSRKFMSKVPYIPGPDEDFSWMAVAEQEIGVGETPGHESNPRVVEYLHATTNLSELNMSNDAVSWCSAFVNWCLKQTGYERTKNALARSWLDWGEKIDTPRRGCIVIFSRDEGLWACCILSGRNRNRDQGARRKSTKPRNEQLRSLHQIVSKIQAAWVSHSKVK
ncbi:MAG: TIGR02594 family protein [Anaerolineales bacterium]|nr:TIGR02594 family protein [Anaerolineales bacterium]